MSTPTGSDADHQAVRTARAPDPRLFGRQVYTMAIQIPSITSRSGSWMVWFASREADLGNAAVDMRPPLPLEMVSPRYVASAVQEKLEGKVRLWGVIGKDGHVVDIALLQHLDDRLDRSAQEALAKWRFQPALRNGVAIDVDAVFEVPFYLSSQTIR
jgi:TonB family protein